MQRRGHVIGVKKAPKGTFLRLLKYIFKIHKYKIFFVIFVMILTTISNIGATYLIQYVLKEALRLLSVNSNDFTMIFKYIILMTGLYILTFIFAYTHLRIMVTVGQDVLVKIRKDLFSHIEYLPLKYFDTNKHGDIMSRFTNDIDTTRQLVSQSIPQLIVACLTLFGYLFAMLITSYILGTIAVIVSLLIFLITRKISNNSRKYFKNQQESLGRINGYIEEMIEGQKVVKVFRQESNNVNNFNKINNELYEHSKNAVSKTGMLVPITVNLGYLNYAITAFLGAYLISINHLEIHQLVLFLLFVRQFTSPQNHIAQQINFVNSALAGANRIFEVLDLEKEEDEGFYELVNVKIINNKLVEVKEKTNVWAWKNTKNNELTRLLGDVRFKDVDFGYIDGKNVLNKVSLYAKPGQKIAFVGSTGAGKTTITNLINRFYDIKSGVITYDGINIKDIKKESLRRSLGIVLQDTNLFTGTVLENIRYGRLDASDEEVIKAAKIANADEFISKLPNGYNTILTDNGSNLSNGQRQLISIARALVLDPPVLILDEATSSIDTHTEKLIQNGMEHLMEGRTVFVIAHRLSTIKDSKAIIVLEHGNIVERGNHQELIDLKKTYYQFYTGLFELE